MPSMLEQRLPIPLLERLESKGESVLKDFENDDDLPLSVAKEIVAPMLQSMFKRSLHGLKDFGDPGQIARQLQCKENLNLAAFYAKARTRRELLLGLASITPDVVVQTLIVVPGIAPGGSR